jgi:hypothetical protein
MPCLLAGACVLTLLSNSAAAQETPAEHVKVSLACGSHSADPKLLKSFQADLQFAVVGSLWLLDRKLSSPKSGEEKFRGVLSPKGAMLIAGLGKADGGENWTYEFSGQKNSKGITVLKGSLTSDQPPGTRICSLTF